MQSEAYSAIYVDFMCILYVDFYTQDFGLVDNLVHHFLTKLQEQEMTNEN